MTAMSLTMNLMSSSNRTFMELKLTHQTSRLPESSAGSNRTFMELKSRLYDNVLRSFASSNRTFMELKFGCNIGGGYRHHQF